MLEAAGLDWEVNLGALYDVQGNGARLPFRHSSDGYRAVLVVVGGRYTPFRMPSSSVSRTFSFPKGFRLPLRWLAPGGRIVWALARMGDYTVIRRDVRRMPVERYLLWTTRHDGLAPSWWLHRCSGGLQQHARRGDGAGLSNRFKIRHTASASERMAEAHRSSIS